MIGPLEEVLYNLKIETDRETSYILEELLAILEKFPTIWEDADKDYACMNLYYIEEHEAEKSRLELIDFLDFHKSGWGISEEYTVSIEAILKEDWSESWKKFFHTKKVSERVVIKPSWEAYTPEGDEVVVEIDPGMSFGTGQHGTTQACLQFLDEITIGKSVANMLDAGTGSGILSIGAAGLGVEQIDAFDYDPDAVRIAGENFELTKVCEKIDLKVSDVAEWPTSQQYDIVVANILCPVLIKNAELLVSVMKESGNLILAGILDTQYEELKAAFEQQGVKELKSTQIAEWRSGLYCKA